jgi:hypothetical protein
MYFNTKSYLKSTRNYITKHALKRKNCHELKKFETRTHLCVPAGKKIKTNRNRYKVTCLIYKV